MKSTKQLALDELVRVASNNRRIGDLPLMGLVEVVNALDAAGLLGSGHNDRSYADACAASAVLSDEGFGGPTLESQVRKLVVAWSDERDAARELRAAAEPIDPDIPIPYTVTTPPPDAPVDPPFIGVPCVVCKQPRDRNDECTNPSCSVYVLPF